MTQALLSLPASRRLYAPTKPKRFAPPPGIVTAAAGQCDERCLYAVSEDCTCKCGGRFHGAGLRCDAVEQDGFL